MARGENPGHEFFWADASDATAQVLFNDCFGDYEQALKTLDVQDALAPAK